MDTDLTYVHSVTRAFLLGMLAGMVLLTALHIAFDVIIRRYFPPSKE